MAVAPQLFKMQPYQRHKLHLCKNSKTIGNLDLIDQLDDPVFLEKVVQLNGYAFLFAPVCRHSKHLALLAARCTPTLLQKLPSIYKFDRDVVRAACLVDPMCINHVNSYFLLDDVPLFRELVAVNGMCVQHATSKVKLCRDVVLAAVANAGAAFQFLPMKWCDEWEFAALAMKKDPRMFKFASCRIKDTEDYALEAIRYAAENFREVSFRLKNDFCFVLAAMKIDPKVISHVTNNAISQSPVIMYEAVYKNPWILAQIPECREMLEDSALLLHVVEQDGTALQYAPTSLRDDEIIGLTAVRQHASAYMYLSPRLQGRREIVLATIHNASQYVVDIPTFYYADPDVLYAAVQSYGVTVLHFPKHLVTKQVALTAVRSAGAALAHMPQWNDDVDVVAAAVLQHCSALAHASEALQLSRDLVLLAVRNDWRAVKYMNQIFRSDREIALEAVAQHGPALGYLYFNDDAEICLLALKTCPNMYDHLCESLITDEAFMLRAVRVQPALLPRLPQTLAFWTAALAHRAANPKFSFFKTLTSGEYDQFHKHVVDAWGARRGGCFCLRIKTPLDSHGLYARRLKRAVLEYAGFPFGEAWDDVRRAHANLL